MTADEVRALSDEELFAHGHGLLDLERTFLDRLRAGEQSEDAWAAYLELVVDLGRVQNEMLRRFIPRRA